MILLLEHEPEQNQTITAALQARGYEVTAYQGGLDVYDSLSTHLYDLALINLSADDGQVDGWALLDALKTRLPGLPVFVRLKDTRRQSILRAYHYGCEEVFKEPFFLEELFFKVDRLLNPASAIELPGGYRYLPHDHRVLGASGEVRLTGSERKLMHLLVQNLGRVVPAEAVEQAIWEEDATEACRHTLLSRMRKKLGPQVIRTVPKLGYTIDPDASGETFVSLAELAASHLRKHS